MLEDKNNENKDNNEQVFHDEDMAIDFPSWDLMPPDLLIKRGNNENA